MLSKLGAILLWQCSFKFTLKLHVLSLRLGLGENPRTFKTKHKSTFKNSLNKEVLKVLIPWWSLQGSKVLGTSLNWHRHEAFSVNQPSSWLCRQYYLQPSVKGLLLLYCLNHSACLFRRFPLTEKEKHLNVRNDTFRYTIAVIPVPSPPS